MTPSGYGLTDNHVRVFGPNGKVGYEDRIKHDTGKPAIASYKIMKAYGI